MAKTYKLTDKDLETIKYLASYGHSIAFIARAIGTTPKSLYHLKARFPRVASALNVSEKELLGDVKANMFRIAIDGQDKHSASLGLKLLDRYETDDVVAVDDSVSDADVANSIMDELNG